MPNPDVTTPWALLGGPAGQPNLALLYGITEVTNAAQRNTLYPAPVIGQRVYRLDTHDIEVWTGAAWVVGVAGLGRMQAAIDAGDATAFAAAAADATAKANAARAGATADATAASAIDATTKANAAQAAATAAAAVDATTKADAAQAAAIVAAAAAAVLRTGGTMTGPLTVPQLYGMTYDNGGGEFNALHPSFGATFDGAGNVTNGDVVLNAFFAALASPFTTMRRGVIPARRFLAAATVTAPACNRMQVRASGAKLVPQGNYAGTPVLVLGDVTAAARLNHAEIMGLEIDPSSGTGEAGASEGVSLYAMHNSRISIMVANLSGDGWGLHQAGYNNDMMHCEAYTCAGFGLRDYTSTDSDPLLNFTPTKWWGGRFEDNGKTGVEWQSPGGWFFGTTFQSNGWLNVPGDAPWYDLHIKGQGTVDAHSCQFETYGPVTRAKKTLIRMDTARALRMFGGYILSDLEGISDKTLANVGIEITDPNAQEVSLNGVKFYGLGIPWKTAGKAISVMHPQYTACLTTNPEDMAPRATCLNFVHLGGQLAPILRGLEIWIEGVLQNFTNAKGIEIGDSLGLRSTVLSGVNAGLYFPYGSLAIIDITATGQIVANGDITSGGKGTFTGDISALGGYRQFIDGWFHNAVVAGMALVKAVRNSWSGISPEVVRTVRAGSITGLNVEVDAAITTGNMTITFYYYRSGNVATAATVNFGVGNFPNGKAVTFAKDLIPFNQNELVWPMISTSNPFVGPTRVRMALEVET